ncbi:Sodium/hydrogen exchanger 4 [Sesamum angolense]|uniref:Sodium/hydrogen exchanger 4 n=1 Tax=Sesamum angolense TaxID=2727404 RepID=A0AAE2BUT3_9LAMI|nr:Sodium/hydrogen exchanger 4 [Sesamum angolense]
MQDSRSRRSSFHNFLTIMLFGVIGVFISSVIITAGSWLLFPRLNFIGLTPRDYLGSASRGDPLAIQPSFWGRVVNDATSVVLFNAIQKLDVNRIDVWTAVRVILDFLYLFSTSTALGVASEKFLVYELELDGCFDCETLMDYGICCANRHSSVRELAVMVLMAYLSYMLAEVMEKNRSSTA